MLFSFLFLHIFLNFFNLFLTFLSLSSRFDPCRYTGRRGREDVLVHTFFFLIRIRLAIDTCIAYFPK